ncbi:long-chain fatty acid transport protein 4 [Anopheles stephensi]|uniref:long-chain fatty acid transport protein 4 n=1 Tax=Anopheles stephensi TaxID=30069 RepID=UPI0007D571E6|nr:long-chain fatty acid transport protein 4 [Anopheles stephensi]XP_035893999.1 long-chain fatty acid transport protein 4 [Anopheles stephensi]
MLVALSLKQKFLTLCGITAAAVAASLVIGQRLIPQSILTGIVFYLISGDRPSTVYASIVSLPRDLRTAVIFLKLNLSLYRYERAGATVIQIFERVVARHPNKVAFLMDDGQLTFRQVKQLADRIAAHFYAKGFRKGDTIALLMETRLEYPCIWLGLSKVGIVTALINSNLRKETLRHSITVANSKAIIVSQELAGAIAEINEQEGIKGLPVHLFRTDGADTTSSSSDPLPDAEDLRLSVDSGSSSSNVDLSGIPNDISPKDKLVYIYTSGTTGMPKAAVITNLRYTFMALGCYYMLSFRDDDIIYNSLPLYHSAGGMIGVGSVLLCGVTAALRKKFSASNFWTDCIRYKCTVAQYIGEICRFLLMTPPKPTDTQHSVRLMFGNGLRPQIWPQFVSRFNIKQIGEFYGSTEGNSNLLNIDNTMGAVGFVPNFAKAIYPVTLIRCDEETGEIIRGSDGFCIKCKPGEPGVFVGKINPKKALNSFVGYADKAASEKKVLHDVFRKGDIFFNSGDILVQDLLGNYYFKDRTGDTFRWRGENVATSEVEGVITTIVGLKDCAVYGVDIPETEGKAGMAAIVDPDNKVDMEQLAAGIRASLPAYARPLFIRVLSEVPMTTTFKLKKRDLQVDGYDLNKVKDPIYFLQSNGTYRLFTAEDHETIKSGKARL